jgi:hypothetical protein
MIKTLAVRVKTPEDKQKVIRAITDLDDYAELDSEGNPVTFWINTTVSLPEVYQMEGVEDAVDRDILCKCGSGKGHYALYDARGIFCAYVCDDCVEEKTAQYRPEVMSNPNYEADEPIESDDY